jgi:pimeloyl-ACP methyl ester carboxylesterase
MPYLELEHSLLHYEEHGEGTELVLLHGACESSAFWKAQIEELQKKHRLILIDLPGHGQSARLGEEVSIPTYSMILREAIQGLDLDLPFLVGRSMGGAIAMTVAVEAPKLLGGLVLANTGAKLGVLPQILAGLETDFAATIQTIVAPRYLGTAHADSLLEWISNEMVLTDPPVGLGDYLACSRFDIRTKLKNISVPCLIISGDQDNLAPTKWAAYLHENLNNSELAVIQGTGHLTMLERPDVFNQVLEEFLSDHQV